MNEILGGLRALGKEVGELRNGGGELGRYHSAGAEVTSVTLLDKSNINHSFRASIVSSTAINIMFRFIYHPFNNRV
ncbi:MAG: hypothetical protein ACJAVY_002501 [Marinoscillum sp.]|jgi:hypothetical protein